MNPNTLLLPTVWPRARPTTLARCGLLALLVHLWLVLTLGSAPGGTARQGEGVWGAINLTLRGPETGVEAPARATVPAPEPAGPVGPAPSPRSGGAVRANRPAADAPAGASRLGDWAPAAQPVALPEPTPAPLPDASDPAPAPLPPAIPPDQTREAQAAAAERALARVAAPAAPAAPTLPSPMAPPRVPEATLASLPRTVPGAQAAPLTPLPALPTIQEAAVVAVPRPAALPVPQPLPLPRQTATVREVPLRVDALAHEPPLPAPASPQGVPGPVPLPGPAPGPVAGRPDAGKQVGQDVATAPSATASAPPRLKLDLPRVRGGELSRGGATGVLQMLPRPPELPDKLAREIDKAGKADCRQAYAGAGLLAAVPLAIDAVRKDPGCKW